MIDIITNPGLTDHPHEPEAAFVLWYRADRPRGTWQKVFAAPTSSGCVAAIGCGGRRHGSWLVLPADRRP